MRYINSFQVAHGLLPFVIQVIVLSSLVLRWTVAKNMGTNFASKSLLNVTSLVISSLSHTQELHENS